jgi:WD40 repeat protein
MGSGTLAGVAYVDGGGDMATARWWSVPPMRRPAGRRWMGDVDGERLPGSWFLLSPDGAWVAATDRVSVQVTDPASGELLWQDDIEWAGEPPAMVAAPDGSWLAVAVGGVTVYDPLTGAVIWSDPDVWIKDLVAAPTAAVLLGTVEDFDHGADIHVWDAATGKRRHSWYTTEGLQGGPDVAVSPDGRWAATRCDTPGHYGGIWTYDIVSGNVRAMFDAGDHDRHMAVGGIAPDSSWLALRGDVERVVLVWHLAEDRTVAIIEYPADDGGRVLGPPVHAISPDSRWLVVGGEVSGVQIHDATTGQLVHRLAEAGAVTRVAIAPDATWLATADGGGVSVWDAATGRRIHRITHGGAQAPPIIAAIGTTTDGGRLAIADADALTVWDPHISHTTAHDLPGRDQTGTPRQIHELRSGRLAVVGEHGIHIINSEST